MSGNQPSLIEQMLVSLRDVIIEECAAVCRKEHDSASAYYAGDVDPDGQCDPYYEGRMDCADYLATQIRALKEKK